MDPATMISGTTNPAPTRREEEEKAAKAVEVAKGKITEDTNNDGNSPKTKGTTPVHNNKESSAKVAWSKISPTTCLPTCKTCIVEIHKTKMLSTTCSNPKPPL